MAVAQCGPQGHRVAGTWGGQRHLSQVPMQFLLGPRTWPIHDTEAESQGLRGYPDLCCLSVACGHSYLVKPV